MKVFMTIAMMLLVMGSAKAGQNQIILNGTKVPVMDVVQVLGREGQSVDAFVSELAPQLRQYTKDTGHEACASICVSPTGQYGAKLISVGSHAFCPVVAYCPTGMTATTDNVHSHADEGMYEANEMDHAVQPRLRVGKMFKRVDPEEFSPEDMKGGATYLVSPKKIQHYAQRRVRVVQ